MDISNQEREKGNQVTLLPFVQEMPCADKSLTLGVWACLAGMSKD